MVQLSPRLAALAALVPPGTRVADVGTDHGYLPIYLIEKDVAPAVVATDVRPGPLAAASRNVSAAGLTERISLRLCDGLEAVKPEEAEMVIIAGMGGETIQGILDRAPWALAGSRRLLLQPQSKQEFLRQWLWEQGCGIRSEHLVEDGGKIYPILLAGGDVREAPTLGELCIGRWPASRRDGLFYTYLEQVIGKLARAAGGLELARRPEAGETLARLRQQLEELKGMRR